MFVCVNPAGLRITALELQRKWILLMNDSISFYFLKLVKTKIPFISKGHQIITLSLVLTRGDFNL
jgi:hypothetical protein